MSYKIIWAPLALETFDKTIEYLNINWTEKEVKKFVNKTFETIEFLKESPYIFRGSEKESIYEAIIDKNNLLIYQIDEEKKEIDILSVWDTRQNPKKKTRKEKQEARIQKPEEKERSETMCTMCLLW